MKMGTSGTYERKRSHGAGAWLNIYAYANVPNSQSMDEMNSGSSKEF